MPQQVEIIGQGTVEFPDEMTPEEIAGVLKNKPPSFQSTPELPPQVITPERPLPETPPVGTFLPRSGMQTESEEARQFVAEPERPGIPIPKIPQQESLPPREGAPVPQGVIIPRSGAQMESLGAREFAQDIPQTGAALANVGIGAVEGLESPQMIAAAPVATTKLAQVLFGLQSFKGAAEQFRESLNPDLTMQERVQSAGGGLTSTLFGTALMKGAIGEALTSPLRIPKLRETQPEVVTATNEALAQLEREQANATQKRQIAEDNLVQHPGDGGVGAPPEAGGGGGAVAGAEVAGEDAARQRPEAGAQAAQAEVAPEIQIVNESSVRLPNRKKVKGETFLLKSGGENVGALEAELTKSGEYEVFNMNIEPSLQGQGHGTALAEALLKKTGSFVTDDSVSASATRVFDSLERRGWTVERNPNAVFEADPQAAEFTGGYGAQGYWKTSDGSPVFKVSGKPQAPVAPEAEPTTTAAEPPVEPPAIGKIVQFPGEPPHEGKLTGLTKDFISEDRAARGEEPLAVQARAGNEETWNRAREKFAVNPNVGHELVRTLTDNPRAVTPDDLGILLRHRVNLTNETEFAAQRALSPDTPLPEKSEALQRLQALQDARNEADAVTRAGGAQWGSVGQFLQQLSTEDYSLSSLIQSRRAAMGGKPIPPEKLEAFTKQTQQYADDILKADQEWQNYIKEGTREGSALKAYKTRLQSATTEYERRLAFSDFEPAIRREMQLDPEAIQKKANFEKARDAFQKQLFKDTQANKPLWQQALGFLSWAARESALSGINTLGKLAAFTGARLGEIPLTETAERVWGTIPGFRQIAATSEFGPGANARQLGEFYKEFATTGMKEAWSMLRGKGSPTRQALEKEKRFGFPSFFGNLHGVEKTPLLIGSQRMNRMKLMQQEISRLSSESVAKGIDVHDPLTQAAINYKAFQKATSDILQDQNAFASYVNRGLEQMEARKKATGEVNATQAVLANLAKIFLTKGIVRVPANYVAQTLQRTPIGLVRGLGGAARAWYKGVGNISPAERSAIMKLMGTGSVGSGFFLWGALDALKSPDERTFGGYYQAREDREKTDDVHFGAIRIAGTKIPHLFTHNPMTESAQMGSTMMRVAMSQISKKDRDNRGLVEGAIKSVFGLAEQAPISGQAFRLGKIGEPGGPTSVVGESIRGLIPQLVQNIAMYTDTDAKRKPRTTVETVKLGIPVLRKQVPEKEKKNFVMERSR